jgi:hypothetical protein
VNKLRSHNSLAMDALVSISNMNNSKNIQQNFEPFLSMDIETKGIVRLTKFVWLNAGFL